VQRRNKTKDEGYVRRLMKETNPETFIRIGKVGSTYGVHGWLRVHTYTDLDTNILKYKPWYLSNNNQQWDMVTLEDGRVHSGSIIVKLAGFNTPEQSRLLAGKIIAIHRSQLPPLNQGEYYWSDLEGLTVINKNGVILGTVSYLIETGANDVLVIKDPGNKEQAIPYLPGKVIINVDLTAQQIHVDWEWI
jgi:16S rRNA processing protein RimM